MTNEKTLAKQPDKSILNALAAGSGEQENKNLYNFIPYITIDNSKVEEELKGGKIVKVLCDPRFLITNKVDKDYTKELFAPEFNASILSFRHRVQRKAIFNNEKKIVNKHSFFRSLEFASFKSDIHIRQEDSFLQPMKYQEVKSIFGDELELWGIAYILIEGEDTVRKAEFKGNSRAELFDYMISKKEFPTAAYLTKFSGELKEEPQPHNKLKLESVRLAPNLEEVLEKQKELNKMLEEQVSPNEVTNEVPLQISIEDKKNDDEIIVNKSVNKIFD